MAEVAAMNKPASTVKAMEFSISGKILRSRFYQNKHYTEIITPAFDEYSHPSKFELRSNAQLGAADQIFTGSVRISGSLAERSYTDKKTGEIKKIVDKFTYLDVVE
jgi:hypothetical protein